MLEKTIKSVLSKKIKKWVESIEDEKLRKEVKDGVIITGGAIVSLVQNEEPNDFDVYFKTKALTEKIARYYCSLWNKNCKNQDIAEVEDDEETDRIKIFISSKGTAIDENYYEKEDNIISSKEETIIIEKKFREEYKPVFLTSNAISLSNKIQLILRFWGKPDEIHETYDFLHCKGYWTSWDNKLEISKEVYEAIINKSLFYTGSLYPVCSLFRMRKFIKRGWTINAGQILKISFQISELNLKNIEVLEDQLVGVDSLYFTMLIQALKNHKEKNKDWNISREYITTIIDKVF